MTCDEDPKEAELNHSYLLGRIAGREEVADKLLGIAADAFKISRDDSAKLLRKWSLVFSSEAKELRREHDKKTGKEKESVD